MAPDRAGQSPAPQWEILQDHGVTDSSEVEDGRYDVPPHRMAPKPVLKRKEGDRPMQTNRAKRPRVEDSIRSASKSDKAGPSRTVNGGNVAATIASSATRTTDSPNASAERLQHSKNHASASKPRSGMDIGRASISAPGGSTSATQPPPRTRPPQPPSLTQPRLRPRPSQVVPNSMKSTSHAPPPVDADIIDISSGDEAPAPRTQPVKNPKRLVPNNAFKKRLRKPESASAPVKVKRKSPPEVIDVLDSDDEEQIRKKSTSAKEGASRSASASTSANANMIASTGATTSTFAKGKIRATESSDASMASGTDIPGPQHRPSTTMHAKGKGKARAVSANSCSDASMAYAPASAPTSRPSSRSDVLPPPSSGAPVPAPTSAPVSSPAPLPPSPARVALNASKVEPATPQRRLFGANPFWVSPSRSRTVSSFGQALTAGSASKPASTSTSSSAVMFKSSSTSVSAAATTPPSAPIPVSPRYTPVVKRPILSMRAPVSTAGSSAGIGAGGHRQHISPVQSPQSQHAQQSQQPTPHKHKQLAIKSTSASRPPVSVSVPLGRKSRPKRVIVSDSEAGSEEDSRSGSNPGPQSHSPSRSHNIVPGAGKWRRRPHTTSDADLEPDTRGLSDALGLTHQQEVLSASHTESDQSSRNSGKGKEKEIVSKRPPLPGRSSATHSRTASASSAILHTATTAGRASPLVSAASPVASQAPSLPGTSISTTAPTPSKSPHINKLPHVSKPTKERKVATPGNSDEALPEESEAFSSDAGYETVIRGSQFIVNKLAQLRKEKSAASTPMIPSTPTAAATTTHPLVHTPAYTPEEQEQPSTSPPPISPTPPLQTSSTSTPAERLPLSTIVAPRPSLPDARTQSTPSQSSVASGVPTSLGSPIISSSNVAQTQMQRVPLPNKHQGLQSISSIRQHSHITATTSATQKRAVNPSLNFEIRWPGDKPIWPPPPSSAPASPTAQEPVTEPFDVSGDVHMITDDEADVIRVTADEVSESDGGALFEVDQSEEIDQSEEEELREIEQVQHEVAEMSQSLAAASLSEPALVKDVDEEIPAVEDRGEGPSRRTTRSSSASSGIHEQMPVTPSSDEHTNALVETGSDGYANSAEDLAAASASRQPRGKTYGGFPVLTWKEYRKNLHNFTPECLYAADIPRALHDHINRLTPHTRLLPGMRAVYEAMMQENTAADEPEAPPVRLLNPVDEEPTPAWEFYYTNKIYHGPGVPAPDIKSLVSCGCRGPCNPKSATCACANRQREAYGNQLKMNFAYDKAGNLLHPGYPIYECNDLCGCGDECMNRVVQHGRKVGVAIRKTPNKGWGIFATQRIASGQFIGIYSGELLTDHEAHERGVKYNKWGKTYLFDIDFHHLKDPDDKNWTNKFTVDAYHCGNFTRFLNHSCDPNSRLYPCYINEGNIQKPLLAIFSRRVIMADEEVCFNYQGNYPGDDDDDDDEEPPITEQEAQERDLIYEKCMCGAKNCTGVMFK